MPWRYWLLGCQQHHLACKRIAAAVSACFPRPFPRETQEGPGPTLGDRGNNRLVNKTKPDVLAISCTEFYSCCRGVCCWSVTNCLQFVFSRCKNIKSRYNLQYLCVVMHYWYECSFLLDFCLNVRCLATKNVCSLMYSFCLHLLCWKIALFTKCKIVSYSKLYTYEKGEQRWVLQRSQLVPCYEFNFQATL